MRKILVMSLVLVFLMTIATAQVTNETIGNNTHWFVDVREGWGFDTGDGGGGLDESSNNTNSTNETETEAEPEHKHIRRKVYLDIYINVSLLEENGSIIINENINVGEDIDDGNDDTDDTEKEGMPTWVKVLLWIVIPLTLIFIGWIVYTIWFSY